MNKELEIRTMEAQAQDVKAEELRQQSCEVENENLGVKAGNEAEPNFDPEVSGETSGLKSGIAQASDSEVSEEDLEAVLKMARKRPVSLDEVERLMGCACIETLKTFMVVGDRDAATPVLCVPKVFLLDEYLSPMNPIGFRQIGDMIKTINLPVNPNSESLFGIWVPPVADEEADWLERRGRFILTLPRQATHVLSVMPLPTPLAVMHHNDCGKVYWTANEAWEDIPKFKVGDKVYFITGVGYANISLPDDEEKESADGILFFEQRRIKYVDLAEQKFCKELVYLRKRQQQLDEEAELELQRRLEFEREFPGLMEEVNDLSGEIDALIHEYPRATADLRIYPMDIEARSVRFRGLRHRITTESIEKLRERVATAKRQVVKYNDNAAVASRYMEVLQRGDFPVYVEDSYGLDSIVPVKRKTPRGLQLKCRSKRIVVSLRREDVRINWYNGIDYVDSIAAYSYDKPGDLQAFQADMEALMKKMPYRYYKRKVKCAFDR